ncbi:MAG: oppC, partial [Chlamydiia bacterium]|nr:oppC [Chlamydiia bacterium]
MNFLEDTKRRFWRQKAALVGSYTLLIFFLIALYAPFLASSKPIALYYNGEWYFPLFRYYFSSIVFSKGIDLFFNILGALFPLFLLTLKLSKWPRWRVSLMMLTLVTTFFCIFSFFITIDPANDKKLTMQKQIATKELVAAEKEGATSSLPQLSFELHYMNDYAKVNLVLDAYEMKEQHTRLLKALSQDTSTVSPYTLYSMSKQNKKERIEHLQKELQRLPAQDTKTQKVKNTLTYIQDKDHWIQKQMGKITFICMPFIRPLHWQDDAG